MDQVLLYVIICIIVCTLRAVQFFLMVGQWVQQFSFAHQEDYLHSIFPEKLKWYNASSPVEEEEKNTYYQMF